MDERGGGEEERRMRGKAVTRSCEQRENTSHVPKNGVMQKISRACVITTTQPEKKLVEKRKTEGRPVEQIKRQ